MSISPIVVAWFRNLRSREILLGGAMLEMGAPISSSTPLRAIEFYVGRHVPAIGSVL
jgi:hypothetical protein